MTFKNQCYTYLIPFIHMKSLFLISFSLAILPGTALTARAQSSVKFIEGIEINEKTTGTERPVKAKAVEQTGTSSKAAIKKGGLDIENCSSIQFKYAQLMNMDVESITNYTLYQFIENWWATRYQYGGTTKEGVDCSAYSASLLHNVYGLGISKTARSQYAECRKIKKKNLQEGDLVFFKTGRGVSHVGVYLRNGYFTHASVSNGVTVSNLDESYYSKRYIGGGRINVNETE
jgi:lipoprotein Spr